VNGSIVNIASILGLRVAGAVAPYAISKAGVIQMTKALALEWARYGIRANALALGYFVTELNDDFFEAMLEKRWSSACRSAVWVSSANWTDRYCCCFPTQDRS